MKLLKSRSVPHVRCFSWKVSLKKKRTAESPARNGMGIGEGSIERHVKFGRPSPNPVEEDELYTVVRGSSPTLSNLYTLQEPCTLLRG